MGARAKVYNARAVRIILGNQNLENGRAESGFCSIKRNADAYDITPSADGNEYAITSYHNESAEVILKFLETSSDLDVIQALYNAQRATDGAPNGLQYSLSVTNTNGRDIMQSSKAFIARVPDKESSAKAGEVEWKIVCIIDTQVVGGT